MEFGRNPTSPHLNGGLGDKLEGESMETIIVYYPLLTIVLII